MARINRVPHRFRFTLLALCALTLAACGGGGGSDDINVNNGGNGNTGGGGGGGNTAGRLVIESNPTTINTRQTSRITVTALNQGNVAQPGVDIIFGASDGILTIERSRTNEFGQASAILDARTETAGTNITVFAETQNSRRIETVVQVVTGGGSSSSSIAITGPTQLDRGATGNFNATLSDTTPPGVANRALSVQVIRAPDGSAPFGTVSPNTVRTDSNGEINFTYTPPDNRDGTGFIRVRTTDAAPNASRTLSVTAGTPTAGNAGIRVDGPTTLDAGVTGDFTATVVDANGSPITSQTVALDKTGPGTLSANSLTTDNNGQVSFGLATDSGDSGTTRINISAAGVNNTTIVNVRGGGSVGGSGEFTFPEDGTTISINQFSGVSFNLAGGPDAAGKQITFTTNLGQIDDNPNAPPAPAATRTLTTDGNGDINFQILSTERGDATVRASGAATGTLDLTFTASANNISVQAEPQQIAPGESSTITATVVDSSGNPLDGVFIQFFVDSNGTGGGGRTPASGTTNAQGQVSTTFTAGPNPGFVQIRSATADQALSQSTQFNVQPAASP